MRAVPEDHRCLPREGEDRGDGPHLGRRLELRRAPHGRWSEGVGLDDGLQRIQGRSRLRSAVEHRGDDRDLRTVAQARHEEPRRRRRNREDVGGEAGASDPHVELSLQAPRPRREGEGRAAELSARLGELLQGDGAVCERSVRRVRDGSLVLQLPELLCLLEGLLGQRRGRGRAPRRALPADVRRGCEGHGRGLRDARDMLDGRRRRQDGRDADGPGREAALRRADVGGGLFACEDRANGGVREGRAREGRAGLP